MNYDTLEVGGVEKSFHDWGIQLNSIRGKKRVKQADTFMATVANSDVVTQAGTPTFAFEASGIVRVNRALSGGVYSGGTVKFIGKRIEQTLKTDGAGHLTTYTFKGPWYDLENSDFLQVFLGVSGGYYLPEVVLFTANQILSVGGTEYAWLPISAGDQIQIILQFVLDRYAEQGLSAPFQYKGRALNAGAVDLTAGSTVVGTAGGDNNFYGQGYNYHLQTGMSIDRSLYSLFLPTLISKPMKASQALQKCLEMSPRINVWFDYTTVDGSSSPLPTIRFDLVDNMTAVTLPLFNGPKYDGTLAHKALNIIPRLDLRLRAAVVKYRITNTVSGSKVIDYAIDKWSGNGVSYGLPGASNVNLNGAGDNANDPNAGLRVLNELVEINGYSKTVINGHLDLSPLKLLAAQTGFSYGTSGDQAAKRSWWSSKRGGELSKLSDSRVRFQDKNGTQTYIPDAKIYYASNGTDSTGASVTAGQEFTSADYAFYTSRIVRGSYQSWMAQSVGVLAVKCVAVAKMAYAEFDAESASGSADTDQSGNKSKHYSNVEHHVNMELTNAIPDAGAGTDGYANFSITASETTGEGYIIGSGGIAEYLYKQMNRIQYEGDYASVASNFVDSTSSQYVTLGNKINLSGGSTEWKTMDAQLQEITEDYGRHETSVLIGVSPILSAGQIQRLFSMWRFRRTWYNPAIRTSNVIGGQTVDLAKANSQSNTVNGLGLKQSDAIFDYSTNPSGTTPGVFSGAIFGDPKLISDILATGTPTPVGTATEMKTMKPREIKVCDDSGNPYYVIVHATEGHKR